MVLFGKVVSETLRLGEGVQPNQSSGLVGSFSSYGSSQDVEGRMASFRLDTGSIFWVRNSEFAHAF